MKKYILSTLLFVLLCMVVLFIVVKRIDSPIIQIKFLSLSQRLIPVLYINPTDRITHYVDNANDFFALSHRLLDQNKPLAVESALRGENSMTLMVAQLRRLQDTSEIPYSAIFDTFTRQYVFLASEKQFDTVTAFHLRNETMAIRIYYNGLPPEKSIEH